LEGNVIGKGSGMERRRNEVECDDWAMGNLPMVMAWQRIGPTRDVFLHTLYVYSKAPQASNILLERWAKACGVGGVK